MYFNLKKLQRLKFHFSEEVVFRHSIICVQQPFNLLFQEYSWHLRGRYPCISFWVIPLF
ncbi:unnamed protein product [Nezara viridula]|uniref:Uncharacterized protein n=1 Tax=Nezara viridula TaxID=85310 RepID=A0A9P0MLP0_NEZVI|nr:unnamed protein product [Nezara viridula]